MVNKAIIGILFTRQCDYMYGIENIHVDVIELTHCCFTYIIIHVLCIIIHVLCIYVHVHTCINVHVHMCEFVFTSTLCVPVCSCTHCVK